MSDLVLDVIAKKNSRALSELADEFDRVANKTDAAGQKMRQTTSFSKFLEDQIVKTKTQVKELGAEFERTGSKDVFARLRGAQTNLKQLQTVGKQLESAVAGGLTTGGQEGAKSISSAISGALSTPVLGPITAGALIAGAVAAGPIVGAVIGGAIGGAVGLGGIFTGAIIQIKDNAQVHTAAKDLGHWLMSQLTADTAPLAVPLEDAFAILKTDLRGPMADLGHDFAYLAPYVRDFASYVGAAAEKFMPGFNREVQSSGPILTELGHGLVMVADGANVMFDEISKGGKGQVEALDMAFRLLGASLAAVGYTIRGAAGIFDGLVQAEKTAVDWTDKWFGSWTLLGPLLERTGLKSELDGISRSFDDSGPHVTSYGHALTAAAADANLTADDLANLSSKISQTATTADTLAAEMVNKVFTATMHVDEATLRWHQSLTSLDEVLKRNGPTLDKHTGQLNLNSKAGQDNEAAILAAVQANMAQYQAQVAVGVSATDAAAAYDRNTAALEAQLRKAHLTQAEIDGLIGRYKSVPDQVNTAIAVQGLTEAINDLQDLMRYLNGLPPVKYIDIITRQSMINNINSPGSFGNPNGRRWGGIDEHAASGLLRDAGVYAPASPARYAFAEMSTGGEAFVPRFGDYNRSASILDQAARWYGGRFVPGGVAGGAGTGAAGGGTDLGTITLVLKSDTGEEIIRKVVTVGRRTNRKTFDTLFPVGSAR